GKSSGCWGSGQASVLKVGSTYFMSHTEFLCDGDNSCGYNRVRTSTNGLTWTAGPTYKLPELQGGPDFMYSSGVWYSVAGGDNDCGHAKSPSLPSANELVVYRSNSMEGAKTEVGCLRSEETNRPNG